MKIKLSFSIFFFLLLCLNLKAQKVKVVDFAQLEKEFKATTDTIKIVNFWATWCGPCIEEMPHFVKAQEAYKNQKVSFSYVSLDFSKQLEKVDQVSTKKGLKGKFYLLKDDPNVYVNKIDKTWEGQIPITLIIKNGVYTIHNAPFANYEELDSFIKSHF